MNEQILYMLLVGCKPSGRHTEQHDVLFAVGGSLSDLIPSIQQFWPEARGKVHIDAWREVRSVDGYAVKVQPRPANPATPDPAPGSPRLYFINLGGYKQGEFEEFHYKIVVAATDKGVAIKKAKETAFYKHTGFKGATSHIDDKYGIDVDDIYELADVLAPDIKQQYTITLEPATHLPEDPMHLGYVQLSKLS